MGYSYFRFSSCQAKKDKTSESGVKKENFDFLRSLCYTVVGGSEKKVVLENRNSHFLGGTPLEKNQNSRNLVKKVRQFLSDLIFVNRFKLPVLGQIFKIFFEIKIRKKKSSKKTSWVVDPPLRGSNQICSVDNCPVGHLCEWTFVRRVICPNGHFSERYSSDWPFVRLAIWSTCHLVCLLWRPRRFMAAM